MVCIVVSVSQSERFGSNGRQSVSALSTFSRRLSPAQSSIARLAVLLNGEERSANVVCAYLGRSIGISKGAPLLCAAPRHFLLRSRGRNAIASLAGRTDRSLACTALRHAL